jgi:2-iminobutanoate/2-iminopropanoate deaminase
MEKLIVKNSNSLAPVGPYSTALFSKGFLFVSGQVGLDPQNGKLVSGGIESELIQVLKNIDNILSSVNLSSKNVVMVSIFILEMKDYEIVNSIYSKWVDLNLPPARQTIAVKELPMNSKIEISLIVERTE